MRGSICRRVPPLAGVSWSIEGTARRREEQAMLFGWKKTRRPLKDIRKDCRGAAAVEFAFLAGFLSLAVVNVSDIGIYLYKRMEVENAAQMGTMGALKACDPVHLPAAVNC